MTGLRPRLSRRATYWLAGLGAFLLASSGLLAAVLYFSPVWLVYLGSYDDYLRHIGEQGIIVVAVALCAWVAYPIIWLVRRIVFASTESRVGQFYLKLWLSAGLSFFTCFYHMTPHDEPSRPNPSTLFELRLLRFQEIDGSLMRTIPAGQAAVITAELSMPKSSGIKRHFGPNKRPAFQRANYTATAVFVNPSFDIVSGSPPSQTVAPDAPAAWVFSLLPKERALGPQEIALDVVIKEDGETISHSTLEATVTVVNGAGLPTWPLALSAIMGAGFFSPLVALAWSRRRDAMSTKTPHQTLSARGTVPATAGATFHINIQNSTLGGAAFGDGATATGSVAVGSAGSSTGSPKGASAPTPPSSPTVDWDVSNRTRTRITELLKDAQPHLGARKNHTWDSTLSGTKLPVWLIQGADRILRQDEGVSVPGFYDTPAEVCDALHGNLFMSYLAACSKYLTQVAQTGTHYQYMAPAEFENRVNTILADDEGFARRATLRDGQWLRRSLSEAEARSAAAPQVVTGDASAVQQSVYLSYAPADEPFMERLFHALEARGVATFFFPQHAPAGVKLGRVARVGISQHDRVVLLCSRVSLADAKVQNDLEQTLEREAREGGSSRLIPVNLDGFVWSSKWQPPHPDVIDEIQGRVMVEMLGAERDAKKFEQGIERLIRALKG